MPQQFIQSFEATDAAGNRYTVHVYEDVIPVGNWLDPQAKVPGLQRLFTADGRPVNYLSKGRYEIAQGGVKLQSNDPAAP